LFRLHQYPEWINTVAVTKDGSVLAVLRGKGKVALWDLTTKRAITELPEADYRALALSATGSLLAVSRGHEHGDPAVELWDVKARALRTTLPCPAPVRSLAFSPDGTLLATFDNLGNIAVVEWASNHTLTTLLVGLPRHGLAGVVAFSPDGSRLAIGKDYGRISLLNWRMGTTVTMTNLTQITDGVTALAFSPTGEMLAAGFAYSSGTIRIWDAHSGTPRGQLTNHTDWIYELAFTPDGQRLVSASADRTIRVWNVADQAHLHCLRGSQDRVTALTLLPDGQTLVSGSNDGAISYWNVNTNRRAAGYTNLTISFGADALSGLEAQGLARGAVNPIGVRRWGFAFTPDGRSFITPDRFGCPGVWDAKSVQRQESLAALGSNNWGLALSPDGRWLAVGNASGKVHIWDWQLRRSVASLGVPFEWWGLLRFSHSGRFLFTKVGSVDHTVNLRIWRTDDWQEVPLAGIQVAGIQSAGFSPDDRSLAVGYVNGSVTLWSFPSGQNEITFGKHRAAVVEVVFSSDGRLLASASSDGCAKLWDVSTGQELATLRGHSGFVYGATFTLDSRRLATGGITAKEAVKLWDTAAQRQLLTLPAEGQFFGNLAFSPDGTVLVAMSFNGVPHLWRAPSWAEIEVAEKGRVSP
jgi:WD40 repeat protein